MSPPGLCAEHGALPSYRCAGCGKWLCYDCVETDDHRFLAAAARCRYCGEEAVAIEDLPPPSRPRRRAADPAPSPSVPAILYTPPPEPRDDDLGAAFAPAARERDATPAFLLFAHHAVVPAATIAMVVALLFFLLDLRSIYLGESGTLKWLGFWFVTATVLIARYGKMSTYDVDKDRQGCYTVALAFATVCVLIASPWQDPGDGWLPPLVDSAIFLAVWRFATRLTAGLSLEGEEWWPQEPRLYGLERLAAEELGRQREDRSVLRLSPRRTRPADADAAAGPRNPSVAVARLALAALLVFALSEPLVLAAPPEVGDRAAAAMIVFLFATAVVLGAASSVAGYRRVRAAGGRASVGVIPGRLAAAAGLMAVILAVASTLPGIEVRGRGGRPPQSTPPVSEGDGSRPSDGAGEPVEAERRTRLPDSPAASLLDVLGQLGRLLRIPFLVAVAALAGFGLWRLWPLLGGFREGLRSRLGGLWARLGGLFAGRREPAKRPSDPLHDLDALRNLPPRDAVLGAYGRLLSFFAEAGHPRPARQTPHEFLSQARRRFRGVARPVGRLTEAYVAAAYSDAEVDPAERSEAIAALVAVVSAGALTLRGPDEPYPSGRRDGTAS